MGGRWLVPFKSFEKTYSGYSVALTGSEWQQRQKVDFNCPAWEAHLGGPLKFCMLIAWEVIDNLSSILLVKIYPFFSLLIILKSLPKYMGRFGAGLIGSEPSWRLHNQDVDISIRFLKFHLVNWLSNKNHFLNNQGSWRCSPDQMIHCTD